MGTIFRSSRGASYGMGEGRISDVEIFGESILKCSFCGKPNATASWQGTLVNVSCCRECAVDVLPRLMADAFVGEHGHRSNMISTVMLLLDKALVAFWRAVSGAIHRTQLREQNGPRNGAHGEN
jgi:hypothetical protein